MDLALSFADHAVTGDGNDDIGRFFVTGRFDGTNGECYGQRLTSEGTPFTIADSAKAGASRDYGNYLTSQEALHLASRRTRRGTR